MKFSLTLILFFAVTCCMAQSNFYDFKLKTIEGKEFDFSRLKGKKVLIVNTASRCGNTPQYKDLEKLYQEYQAKGFVILGFPSNDFLGQEPGANKEIADFCKKEYNVTFPMFEKVSVKGKDINSLYAWLTQKELNKVADAPVKWNFQKFLIDGEGNWVNSVDPKKNPYDEEILKFLNTR